MKKKLTLLPILIIVACVTLVVRLSDIMHTVSNLSNAPRDAIVISSGQALAKEEKEKKSADKGADEHDMDAPKDKAGSDSDEPEDVDSDISRWTDADDMDLEVPELRVEMFKALIKRREDLDKRQRILQQREALLRAAEQELEKKYDELTNLRKEINGLLETQSEQEKARIASLVKTYEGMKAKDAARIFNTLVMDVLLEVMSGMSERKIAPILAEMETEKARQVTVLLAEQKKLPSLPSR